MTGRNLIGARGYVNARDGLDAYKRLLIDLGLRDRDPFDTLHDPEGPFAAPDPRETFLRESTGIGSEAPLHPDAG